MITKTKILIGILIFGLISGSVFFVLYILGIIPIAKPGPPILGTVSIFTNKTEYEQGGTTKITVKNYSDQLIWYNKETCPPFCVQLEKLENDEWINVGMAIPVVVDLPVRASSLQPYEEIMREWDMFIVKPVDQIITAESGKYRFSFSYGLSQDNFTERTTYSNEFTIKETISPKIIDKEVIITTDKTEYALGEKAKITVRNNTIRNNIEQPIWYVDYVCPPWWKLEIQESSNWKLIDEFSPQLFKDNKEEYAYCPPRKPVQDLVKKLEPNSEISKIWSLSNYEYHNSHTIEGLAPGNYRLSFTYGFTQDTYNTDLLYSNEFEVKKGIWRKISDACKENKGFIEKIRSDPDCLQGKGFRCVDGWGGISYYDKRLVSASTIKAAANFPLDMLPSLLPDEAEKELSKATIAVYSQSSCACEKPIGYKILIKDKLEEVTCEEFYQFLQNYESSCGDCILMWSYGCC